MYIFFSLKVVAQIESIRRELFGKIAVRRSFKNFQKHHRRRSAFLKKLQVENLQLFKKCTPSERHNKGFLGIFPNSYFAEHLATDALDRYADDVL